MKLVSFILKKSPYYIRSLVILLVMTKNPWALISYAWRYPLGKSVVLKFKNGLELETTQPLDALIIKETIYDDSYGLRDLKDPKCIIDVGSALGDYALFAALLYPHAEIIAFEPNPNGYTLLEKNIKRNACANIRALNVAAGIQETYTFYVALFNVRSSIIKDAFSEKKIIVKGQKLDEVIKNRIDVIKIDCEGAELDVLKSISAQNMKKVQRIVCEYHNHLIKNEDAKIAAVLQKHDFAVSQIEDPYNANIGYVMGDR